ncbi:MAG: hypothetical protein ACLP7O_08480 [Terracidiphilus sp.]
MGSRSNVRIKLWEAIDTLVTNEGSLQKRLASAAISLTGVYLPSKSDLPKKYQEAFESIIQDLTKEPAVGSEGKIQATTYKMNDQEAEGVAKRILSLYIQLKGGI